MTDNMLLLEEFFAPAELNTLWTFAMSRRGGLCRERSHQ